MNSDAKRAVCVHVKSCFLPELRSNCNPYLKLANTRSPPDHLENRLQEFSRVSDNKCKQRGFALLIKGKLNLSKEMFSPKGRAQTAKQHTTNPPHSSYVPLIQKDPFSAILAESKSIFSHFSFSCLQSRVHTLTATDEQSEETEDGPNHFQQVLMDSGQCSKWVERTLDAGSPSPRVSVAGAHELAHYSLAHCLPQTGSVEEL